MWSYITFIVFLVGIGAMLLFMCYSMLVRRYLDPNLSDILNPFRYFKNYKNIYRDNKDAIRRYKIFIGSFIVVVICMIILFLITRFVGFERINELWQQFD